MSAPPPTPTHTTRPAADGGAPRPRGRATPPTPHTPPPTMAASVSDAEYARWRAGAPLLYDWLSSQSLLWPSLSCR